MGREEGLCHICGNYGALSPEHVPPQKALNSNKAFLAMGKQILSQGGCFPWEMPRQGLEVKQGGVFFNTLCYKCNNDTGAWYGGSFVEFVNQGYQFTERYGFEKLTSNKSVTINVANVYPLRILKQIITMFFSVNTDGFSKKHTALVRFIKNKHNTALGLFYDNYALSIYLLKGEMRRYIGVAGVLDLQRTETRTISEISCPPFGYVLEIGPSANVKNQPNNIIGFSSYSYNDRKDIHLKIPVNENNTGFPLDYRTKPEIIRDRMNEQR